MTLAIILLIVAMLLALGWADHQHRCHRQRRQVRRRLRKYC